MSWLRIEGRMPLHRKVAPLSDAAFRLHVTASCWCCDEETDGRVPKSIPATLTRAPRGRALTNALKELTDASVWEIQENGDYIIHDFLVYNPSAAQSKAVREAKAAAGAAGGKQRAHNRHSKSLAGASPPASEPPSTDEANAKQKPSPTRASAGRSDSDSESDSQTTTPAPPPAVLSSQNSDVPCPVPLPLADDDFARLELDVGIPRKVSMAWLRQWASDELASRSNPRPVSAWVKCGLKAIRGTWSDGSRRAEMRALAEPKPDPEPREQRTPTFDDVMGAR